MRSSSRWLLWMMTAFLAMSWSAAADPAEWRIFESAAGRFHVLMPGTPRLVSSKVSSPAGPVTKNVFASKSGPLDVSVEYSDVPGLAFTFGSTGAIFDHAGQEFLKDMHAREMSRTKISYEKHAGREIGFEIPGSDPSTGHLKMYLVGHRLYCLAAFAPRSSAVDPARIEAFFSSFGATR